MPTICLFIGIDIGKRSHVAAFVSEEILRTHRLERSPYLKFGQDRAGVTALLARIKALGVEPSQCAVLLEHTGHYHRPVCEQLIAAGCALYTIGSQGKRLAGRNKSDLEDARSLAFRVYTQVGLALAPEVRSHTARPFAPDLDIARRLATPVRRHHELGQQVTRAKNRLIAICDEIFPEFTEVFRDPNAMIALELRSLFGTPAVIAAASLEELRQVSRNRLPGDRKLLALQEIARVSIGTTDTLRVAALLEEQQQLIEEYRLLDRQRDAMEARIETLVQYSREGQILLSLPCIGFIHAATIIVAVGNIRNFPRVTDFRKFAGWAPRLRQTGSSYDRADLGPNGARLLRTALYLATCAAVSKPGNFWHRLYERLVPLKCSYDARKKRYLLTGKVIGRIAGQMAGVIFTLLRADAQLVDQNQGGELPPPQCYDPALHTGTVGSSLTGEVI
jgi:transposase